MQPQLRRGQSQTSQPETIIAPIKGMDAIVPIARMPETSCIFCRNILPEDAGMEVRDGYVEWANGWTGDPARTVITFEGNLDSEDQLWVANAEGIWNVTTEGTTAPVQELVWPSSVGNAGICSYVNFTNDGNERFILLCDGENGYYVWTQTTGLWTVGSFSGGSIDVGLLNFVMIWKKRVWFVERDSANAWYLPVASFSGVATPFNFGDQFRFGGSLVSLHNWTLDGGAGIDDHLVAISGAGDVIIYQGTDPAATNPPDFGLIGSWYVGELPAGNRVASEFSGELYVLSVQGLLPMSKVLNGAFNEGKEGSYITAKISPLVRSVMDEAVRDFGWHVHIHPKQSLLYINTPPRTSKPQIAFTLYFGTDAWGTIADLNKSHTANWQGEVYWTDINLNKIYVQKGNVDAVYLDQEADGLPQAIDWQLLTSYQSYGHPAVYKRCQYIRPMFIGGGTPAYNVVAFYDFDIKELTSPPSLIGTKDGIWEDGVWDIALWGGNLEVTDNPRGANGMGRHIAINIRGRTSESSVLVGFDVITDSGGMM